MMNNPFAPDFPYCHAISLIRRGKSDLCELCLYSEMYSRLPYTVMNLLWSELHRDETGSHPYLLAESLQNL